MTPEEFNRIIIPIRESLKGLARMMTGDDDRAEDLVQEVMLKLWSIRDSPDRYDNKRNLAVTIMRNKVSDQWRHRQLECGKPATESRTADTARMIGLIRQTVGHLPEISCISQPRRKANRIAVSKSKPDEKSITWWRGIMTSSKKGNFL